VTRDGFCWVATTNSLLLYKDPIAAADEVKVIKSAKPNIISLAEDREGALWMGTREGKIWQLHENKWLAQTNFPSKCHYRHRAGHGRFNVGWHRWKRFISAYKWKFQSH